MVASPTCSEAVPRPSRRWPARLSVPVAAILLVDLALIAYYGSFRGVFLLDDIPHIIENPTIRRFPATLAQMGTGGRPLLFLSLAFNYAVGGLQPLGYHVFNFIVHALAGLTLFGIARRTLLRWNPAGGDRAVNGPALAIALLWMVHPLQTQSVTYIVQRCESMMGACFLLLLYGVIRSVNARRPWLWLAAAGLAGLIGFGCKEVMVSAPLVVVLYDRVFLASSWRELLWRRGWLYVGLGSVAVMMIGRAVLAPAEGSDVSAGFGLQQITPVEYLWTQASVILHYLRLTFWPSPLCLDPLWPVTRSIGPAVVPGLIVLGLLAVSVGGLVRRAWWGWLGVSFFLILAPTSSVLPIADTAMEHRMYLPLAAVIALVVLTVNHAIQMVVRSVGLRCSIRIGLLSLATGLLMWLTWNRNQDYQDAVRMWSSVVRVAPHNPRAQVNLGIELGLRGDRQGERRQYELALQAHPRYPKAHLNLGIWHAEHGDQARAVEYYREAIRLRPRYAKAYAAYANLLARQDELENALEYYRRSLEIEPDLAPAHLYAGQVAYRLGQSRLAVEHLRRAVQLTPEIRAARRQLAWILATTGDDSLRNGREALQWATQLCRTTGPARSEELDTLAAALAACGRFDEAVTAAIDAQDHARRAELDELAEQIDTRLESYRQRRPWIEATPPAKESP
ncbi:MAG: tetratricopeptide repeat protein [Pirellulaceae bacterium]|nr:tetratricopeptide repeat protein [Pirellulaceae bacterium]